MQVGTEISITEGRIDILIETPSALIAVENKPYAALQHRQLERYGDHVCTHAGDRMPALVFLSNWETDLEEEAGETASRREGLHFAHLPFADGARSLAETWRALLPDIRAERTRHFVTDVVNHMDRRLGGIEREIDPMREEIRERLESGDGEVQARIMAAIVSEADTLRDWALDRIGAALLEALPGNYEISTDHGDEDWPTVERDMARLSEAGWQKHAGWTLRNPKWPYQCYIALSPERTNRGEIVYGIYAPNEAAEEYEPCPKRNEIEQAISEAALEMGATDHWPAVVWIKPSKWDTMEIARLIQDHQGRPEGAPAIQEMITDMVRLGALLDNL